MRDYIFIVGNWKLYINSGRPENCSGRCIVGNFKWDMYIIFNLLY